jgi:beta-glucosidase
VSEAKTIHCDLTAIIFYNNKLEFGSEPGDFDLVIGSSSSDVKD